MRRPRHIIGACALALTMIVAVAGCVFIVQKGAMQFVSPVFPNVRVGQQPTTAPAGEPNEFDKIMRSVP